MRLGRYVRAIRKFPESRDDKYGDISIYVQESNATTSRIAIHGIEADIGAEQADIFRREFRSDLRAGYVLANPPLNDSDWFRKDDDARGNTVCCQGPTPTSRDRVTRTTKR